MTHLRKPGATPLALALTLLPAAALGQAVTDPNEIVGEVRFLVTNPAILDVLGPLPGLDEGLTEIPLTAESLVAPALTHATGGRPLPGGLAMEFDLTVESSLAGIPYRLGGEARFDGVRDRYALTPITTAPVLPDPAPDVDASITECLSMLDVRYLLDDGSPLPWAHGRLFADRETAPGSGDYRLQAHNLSLRAGDFTERLPVHGGARFEVLVQAFLTFGSDPELDLVSVQLTCERELDVPCDEMVPITCVFTAGDCEGPGGPMGAIAGELDVLGHEEAPSATRSAVAAWDGPMGNARSRVLRADPSSGPYELVNVVPDPVRGYRVDAEADLRRSDGTLQRFTFPELGFGSNPRVPVPAGVVTDLGDTFVVNPTHVTGSVLLAGPPPRIGGALLADVREVDDIRRRTIAPAHGLDVRAPGARATAVGAATKTPLRGGLDLSGRNWSGTWDFVVGGLHAEPSTWDLSALHVALGDTSDPSQPESWHDQQLVLTDREQGSVTVDPGGSIAFDRRYCVSEIHLGFESTTGVFVRPYLRGSGTFTGADFQDRLVDQDFSIEAEGLQEDPSAPSDRGTVVMTLPQADWVVVPRVNSVSPRGNGSDTELPHVEFPVGCRQVIRLVSQLVPILGTLPECVTDASTVMEGSFRSQDEVVHVRWSLNGGPATDLCSPCGLSPSFSFPVSWLGCENEILIEAEDVEGRTASVTGYVMYDGTGPVVETTRMVLWPPNHASWCYEDASRVLGVADACPGAVEWRLTSCRSSQPDDVSGDEAGGNAGDGVTTGDCLLSADGRGFCVRAERLGGCAAGRTYSVGLRAVDGCGNVTETAIEIEAPHEWTSSLARDVVQPDARIRDGAPPFAVVVDPDPDAHLPSPFTCR